MVCEVRRPPNPRRVMKLMRKDIFSVAMDAVLGSLGYKVVRRVPHDIDAVSVETLRLVEPFTMMSPERLYALCSATEYVARHKIPGGIVECGVWKGGGVMAVAHTLLRMGVEDYDLFLFDTFEGMPEPSVEDVLYTGESATDLLARAAATDDITARASLADVKSAVLSVGYDPSRLHFVEGLVEDTLPARRPEAIALLHLDTDWYQSTLHELTHLYPRLSPGGVLIIDDYGHWKVCAELLTSTLRPTTFRFC